MRVLLYDTRIIGSPFLVYIIYSSGSQPITFLKRNHKIKKFEIFFLDNLLFLKIFSLCIGKLPILRWRHLIQLTNDDSQRFHKSRIYILKITKQPKTVIC